MNAESIGHEGLPPMTEADFLAWQDAAIENAKDILKEDGELRPLVFILTLADHIKHSFRPNLVPLDAVRERRPATPLDWAGATGRYITAVLPLSHDPDTMWEYGRRAIKPEKREGFDEVLAIGAKLGIERTEAKRRALKVLLQVWGLHEKDLIAGFIKECLRETRAMAYIKMDDAYIWEPPEGMNREQAIAERPESLADVPTSRECIMASLETQSFARVVTVPYERERPREGAVTRFLPIKELRAERGAKEGQALSGRFMWMLPAPA